MSDQEYAKDSSGRKLRKEIHIGKRVAACVGLESGAR
jgi:hypothetical protein